MCTQEQVTVGSKWISKITKKKREVLSVSDKFCWVRCEGDDCPYTVDIPSLLDCCEPYREPVELWVVMLKCSDQSQVVYASYKLKMDAELCVERSSMDNLVILHMREVR